MGLIFLYIEKMMGYMIVALPIYIVGRIIYIKKKQKQVNVLHEVLLSIFVLYIVGLASQTIIPYWSFGFLTDTKKFFFDIYLSNENATVNLIPFNTLFQYFFHPNANVGQWGSVSLLNLTANILLFTPIGFFIPLIWARMRSFRKILLVGLGVTCFIEVFQLFIGRSTDIDDVILNTIGIIIGYGLFSLLKVIRGLKLKN